MSSLCCWAWSSCKQTDDKSSDCRRHQTEKCICSGVVTVFLTLNSGTGNRLCVKDFCLYSSLLLLCSCSWRNLWKIAFYSDVTQLTASCCYQEIHLISVELIWQTLVKFLCFMSQLQETCLQKQSILSIPLVTNRLLLFVSYPKQSILGSLSWDTCLQFFLLFAR